MCVLVCRVIVSSCFAFYEPLLRILSHQSQENQGLESQEEPTGVGWGRGWVEGDVSPGTMFLQTFRSVNLGEKVQKKVLHYFLLITVTVKRAVVLWSDINLKK